MMDPTCISPRSFEQRPAISMVRNRLQKIVRTCPDLAWSHLSTFCAVGGCRPYLVVLGASAGVTQGLPLLSRPFPPEHSPDGAPPAFGLPPKRFPQPADPP
ncbi:unnamed protein product [Ectocarpus sp. 8 AP-2014]